MTQSRGHVVTLEEMLSFEARALKLFTQANKIVLIYFPKKVKNIYNPSFC